MFCFYEIRIQFHLIDNDKREKLMTDSKIQLGLQKKELALC